jgi:hypothetical protein
MTGPSQQVSAYLEIHTKRYGCFNFSRWIIPKIQKFVHLSYFCCPIPSLPKLGSSSSQKPAQQHFSSPQAAAHVIFKGWTTASSLSLCAGQQQLKDRDSMGSKVPHAQASPVAPKAAQQHVQGSSSFLHACST